MPENSDIRLAVHIAALCSLGAAVIHGVVAAPHGEEWWASGVFFAALAGFQGLWALLALLAPHARWLVALAVPVNLGAAALWVVSRFWSVPAGPAAGTTEAIGVADLSATLLGLAVAALAVWALVPRTSHATLRRAWHARVLGAAVVVVALVAAPGAIAGPDHSHAGDSHDDGGHHDAPAEEGSEPTKDDDRDRRSPKPSPSSSPVPEETADGHHDDGSHGH